MHYRSFSLDKLKNRVGRRASEPSLLDPAQSDGRDSNPKIIISDDQQVSFGSGTNGTTTSEPQTLGPFLTGANGVVTIQPTPTGLHGTTSPASRLRAQSLSLMHTSRSRSRSRSCSTNQPSQKAPVNKKQTKELIKYETAQVVLKKIVHILEELGLQNPIPLKTTNNSFNGSVSKSTKIYVANANDCIYLAPASSASFTYEDVENGGGIAENHRSAEVVRTGSELHERNDTRGSEGSDSGESTSIPSTPGYSTGQEDTGTGGSQTPIDEVESDLFDPLHNSRAEESGDGLDGLGNPGLRSKLLSFNSPNYLCTKIDSDTPIPHTFAVIIDLNKDTLGVKDVKFQFQSITNLLWPTSDAFNKSCHKELFRIGHMEWFTSLNEADFYVNATNSNDVKFKKVSPDDLAKRTRDYKLLNIRDLANGAKSPSDIDIVTNVSTHSSPGSHTNSLNTSSEVFKAGLYVFLLPILLPEHIPPTITSINGSLNHILGVSFTKNGDKFNRKVKVSGTFNLPMVRTPPSIANSIADKPIYVNRVWNNAIHYIITFPKKYVSLGSEHVINVKLVPLVKDVVIKRIKFNILERITYVSKNLSREYEYDSEDPYYLRPLLPDNKPRERVVTLCELKTKAKTGSSSLQDPYKEEVIKCPDNNLLFVCYELEKDENDTMIASPLDINIALPFLTTKSDKMAPDDELMTLPSNPTSRRASIVEMKEGLSDGNRKGSISESPVPFNPSSPIIGALETNLLHGSSVNFENDSSFMDVLTPDLSNYMSDDHQSTLQPTENIQMGYTSVIKALAPDSNFRHIQVNHRLQVCFRISKPDPKDDFKMHHYEVVVDTPLILVSAKCNEESVQLPEYDEIDGVRTGGPSKVMRNGIEIKPLGEETGEQLPSFEEATSPLSSPITRSVSIAEDPLSRIPSISGVSGPPLGHSIFNPAYLPREPAPAYEPGNSSPSSFPAYDSPVGFEQIDQVVNEASPHGNRRQSRLRSSLVSSFAKTDPRGDNNERDHSQKYLTASGDIEADSALMGSEGVLCEGVLLSVGGLLSDGGLLTDGGILTDGCLLDLEVDPSTVINPNPPGIASSVMLNASRSLNIDPLDTTLDSNHSLSSQYSQQIQDSAENGSPTPTNSIDANNEPPCSSTFHENLLEPLSMNINLEVESTVSTLNVATRKSLSTGLTSEEVDISKMSFNDEESLISKAEQRCDVDDVSIFTQNASENSAKRLPLLQHTEKMFTTNIPSLLHLMTPTTANSTLPIKEECEKDLPGNISEYLAENLLTSAGDNQYTSKPPEFLRINKY
jgi:hypothetical protein